MRASRGCIRNEPCAGRGEDLPGGQFEAVAVTGLSRPRIGYVVKMFPRLSETFIRNEIRELERQGLDLHIFSIKRPTEAEAELVVGPVRAPVTYLPERV